MKKHSKAKHSNILKMYVNEIIQQQHFAETKVFEKQSSKV